MSNFNPNCILKYNCGAEDFDFFATWGSLTVQRQFLRYIQITLNLYNQIDGWKNITKTFIPPNATSSLPFSFFAELNYCWCKTNTCDHTNYFGKKYKFNTSMFILSGGVPGIPYLDEEYTFNSDTISTNLKFCKTDPFYVEFDPVCTNKLPDCIL